MESKCHKHGCITVKSITNAFHVIIFIVMKLILIVLVLMGGVLARMKVKAGGRTYKPSTPFAIMGNVTSLVNMIDELWNQRATLPELWLKGDQHNYYTDGFNVLADQTYFCFPFAVQQCRICSQIFCISSATCQRLVWSKLSRGTMD